MELTFGIAGDFVKVRIRGINITFTDSNSNFKQYAPLEMLKLDKQGIIMEHPDLKDLSLQEMRKEAVKRFKDYIEHLGGENEIKKYITTELENKGYSLKLIEKEGFRPEKCH